MRMNVGRIRSCLTDDRSKFNNKREHKQILLTLTIAQGLRPRTLLPRPALGQAAEQRWLAHGDRSLRVRRVVY